MNWQVTKTVGFRKEGSIARPVFRPLLPIVLSLTEGEEVIREQQSWRKRRLKRRRAGGRQGSHFITEWPGNVRDEERVSARRTQTLTSAHTQSYAQTHTSSLSAALLSGWDSPAGGSSSLWLKDFSLFWVLWSTRSQIKGRQRRKVVLHQLRES